MGKFDFLNPDSQSPRPTPRPPSPAAYPVAVETPSPSSAPRFRPDPSKEQYLRLVIALTRVAAFLYFLFGLAGVVVVVFGLSREQQVLAGFGLAMIPAGIIGAIACMAGAELVNLAIRATLAVEETAFTLRYMRRG